MAPGERRDPMSTAPFCADTYSDALLWTVEAISSFIREAAIFLKDNAASVDDADARTLQGEINAAVQARRDRRAA